MLNWSAKVGTHAGALAGGLASVAGGSLLGRSIRHAYLIGSQTTSEQSTRPGASDIDLLLVVDEDLDLHGQAQLRKRTAVTLGSSDALGGHMTGVRCRHEFELEFFVRYLALQGYHSDCAVSLYHRDYLQTPLPAFSNVSVSRQEYICILGECLWGEIRALAAKRSLAAHTSYGEAKSLLAYVNLLLTSIGIFLPTHGERVVAWSSLAPPDDRRVLAAAARIKKGETGTEDSAHAIQSLLPTYRETALQAVVAVQEEREGFDPAQFWIGTHRELDKQQRLLATIEVCNALHKLLQELTATRHRRKLAGTEVLVPTFPPLELALSCPAGTALSTITARINRFRLGEAQPAWRDWG